jgi:hypothetical protein
MVDTPCSSARLSRSPLLPERINQSPTARLSLGAQPSRAANGNLSKAAWTDCMNRFYDAHPALLNSVDYTANISVCWADGARKSDVDLCGSYYVGVDLIPLRTSTLRRRTAWGCRQPNRRNFSIRPASDLGRPQGLCS